MILRKQFSLPGEDEKFLEEYGLPWETIVDGSQWVLVHDFPLPDGYNNSHAVAAIRMETGYPNAELHMVYFYPAITRRDGKPIAAAESPQPVDGKIFQRWSRHRSALNPWKAGQDSLGTHLILIEDWLEREFKK
jgi:Prokaryotic E2 family E